MNKDFNISLNKAIPTSTVVEEENTSTEKNEESYENQQDNIQNEAIEENIEVEYTEP